MRVRNGIGLGIMLALSACGGRSVESGPPSEDASIANDAAGEAGEVGFDATFAQCPASAPRDGSDCNQVNAIGLECAYGSTACTCKGLGHNSAAWACVTNDVDAGPIDCTYDDGGAELDAASRFHGSCAGGCPPGTVCAVEIGGVAGGGGEYCAPITDHCKNDVTCACLAPCVCGVSFGRPEHCSDTQKNGTVLECDNWIR